MRKLILVGLVFALQAFGAITYVNSVRCGGVTSCTTTWSVTPGNVLAVGTWGSSASGTITTTGITYTVLRDHAEYHSYTTLRVAALASSGSITVASTATESNILIAEFRGVSLTVDISDSYGYVGPSPSCPATSPLSVSTTGPDLLLSIWAMESSGGTCAQSSGTLMGTDSCAAGGGTGRMAYQIAASGTWTQQFTFSPGYNDGNTNCGIYALKAATVSAVRHRMLGGE